MKRLQRWWKIQHIRRMQRALAEVELAEMEMYRLLNLPMDASYSHALESLEKGIRAYRRFLTTLTIKS